MTATPYVAMDFAPNTLVEETVLDRLVNNVQWIYENKPTAKWSNPDGTERTEGVKLLGGKLLMPITKAIDAGGVVRFNEFFNLGCAPVITTTLISSFERRIHHTIAGIGQLQPDETGFNVYFGMDQRGKKKVTFTGVFALSWIAMGF